MAVKTGHGRRLASFAYRIVKMTLVPEGDCTPFVSFLLLDGRTLFQRVVDMNWDIDGAVDTAKRALTALHR